MASKTQRHVFCLSFARGCCGVGHECNYLHRIPLPGDEKYFTPLYDCFGRDKYMVDRYDMGGTGSFSRENRTLYVGGISSMTEDIESVVRAHFSEWGEIESIKVLPRKYVAFVKYTSQLNAEYAKEAMFGQSLEHNELLNVRWSIEDPNPKVKAEIQRHHEITFSKAFLKDKPAELLTAYEMYDREEEQERALLDMTKRRKLESTPTLVASAYPNTHHQYLMTHILGHREEEEDVAVVVAQKEESPKPPDAISLLAHYDSDHE
jgi:hypothetical protein